VYQAREHRHDAIGQHRHAVRVVFRRVTEKRSDFDRRCRFHALAASHGESASLIGPRHAPCALGAVATDALCGAESLVAKFRVFYAGILDGDEHLESDSEDVKFVMRQTR
jgi:hypothetical protein